jgi:hypothetical protein
MKGIPMMRFILLLSLTCCISHVEVLSQNKKKTELKTVISYGGIIRGDTTMKKIALVFTGDEFADGGDNIAHELKKKM